MGKLLDRIFKKTKPTITLGSPGFIIMDGFLADNEKNAELSGTRQFQTYSNLLANVSIVSAGTRYFLNLVSNVKWTVTAADDSDEAEKYAQIIRDQMKDMDTSWPRVIRRAAMYRFYGFSIQEWTAAKNKDGVLVLADIAPRPQTTIERWDIDANGKVVGVWQQSPQTFEETYLPREKLIYMVDDSLNDSPTGLGLFRHIVESANRLTRYEQLEGYGFESDLRGIPIGRAPFAALAEAVDTGLITKAESAQATEPLTKFITNHIKNPALGILLDSIPYESQGEDGTPSSIRQWDVDLLKGSSTSLPDMAKAIERVNREIARTLGVEGLLLGEGASGSHALSKDKSSNFALIVDSTLNELGDTFDKDMVKRTAQLNGWPDDKVPTAAPEEAQHRNITQITTALKDLASSGGKLVRNDPAVNEVRQMLGLSEQPEVSEEEFAIMQGKGTDKQNDQDTPKTNPGVKDDKK